MRVRYLSVFLLLLIPFGPATAASDKVAKAGATVKSPKIVLDEQRNEIHFVIDGKIAVVLDADGLRVRESIEYGGTLTDTGTLHYDKQLPDAGGAAEHE